MTDYSSPWKNLAPLAGWAAILLLFYSLVTMASLIALGGMPETAREGFALLAENRLAGLLRLDILTILVMPLYYLLLLGLYAGLRNTEGAKSLLAALLGVAGVTLVLATPSAFSFLTLSDKFAAATDETQRALLLAAGEAVLATDLWHGSGALMGGLLIQTSTLIFSVVMLRSAAFGKLTAWVGVVTHGLDLLHILAGFFVPAAGTALMMIAGPLYLVWFPLLARDFFRSSNSSTKE
jgi:hypothetical protein